MSSVRSNRFAYDLMKGTHGDLTGITIKMILLDTTYTPNPDHKFVSDVSAHELATYTRQALTTKTLTQDDTNDFAKFSSDDPVFTAINSGTIGFVGFMRDRGGADSANELFVTLDNADMTTNGGNVTVHCPTTGWWNN